MTYSGQENHFFRLIKEKKMDDDDDVGPCPPWVGVSLMPHHNYRRAIQPLLDDHLIDAVEWR